MKLALCQTNPIIGDIAGNTAEIREHCRNAAAAGATLAIFPEMSITGYPPMDLIENPAFIEANLHALYALAEELACPAVIGYIAREPDGALFNAAALIADGEVQAVRHKMLLPTYDVFDESRYFRPATETAPVHFAGTSIGITICEDIWNSVATEYTDGRRYDRDPVRELVAAGAELIINISASPFVMGKNESKREMISTIARTHGVPLIYVNQCGGNDSLVFDGGSFIADAEGAVVAACRCFAEDLLVHDLSAKPKTVVWPDALDEVHDALVLGLRDYAQKSGFRSVLLGLSGGIDSALTATLAARALGAENVTGVTMPSRFSSAGSVDDSRALADNLGIRLLAVPIGSLYDTYLAELSGVFHGRARDVTEENLQARIRGTLLMAMSNKFGSLLLTTGNKSELAMGYCTLYGDMNGGLAVISDLPKTLVYALSEHINRNGEIIPRATITKAPSAELRENQTDQDTLPPYDILDGILECYVEKRMSSAQIIAQGYDPDTVQFVLRGVDRNEYKRRQAAPGLKVTTKAFGIGRRIPIVQKFRP